ncbi:TRAP transporter, substrate binding protein, DctP family [Malaciobacter molluscorum LMG 25693]|uniref:TRAP transporter, substrate binding protein, DctP family n=2 Tax=Malaciobacter molluscorum LMG 25693 TaxID=870501 RepID=A0AB33GUW5_9BACT|nr:TRAP transporter substrate-binding protein [Malaciobacter molluscorum]AXX92922.1 TRAP transporter, substrate binding protein, DctP family [Malaciobacter molluscorum LMG 25693]
MTKIMKGIVSSAVVASALFFTGCGDNKGDSQETKASADNSKKTYVLKFSHVVSANTPKGKAADYFEKRLEELSNGQIDVQVYPSSQLYKDNAVLKALKLDSVQMAAPSFSKFGKIVPQLALFDLPFLFKDIDHLHRVQDGEVGKELKSMVTEKGYKALSFWDNNFKQFTSSKKPILMPSDAEGQKFRIMSSKVLEEQFKAVGASPQMMPFSEVYSALQQGVIDAAENPISNIYTKKFHEVQKYLTISNHGYLGYLVVMSEKFWNSLTPELQKDVEQAMKEATQKEREYANELDKEQFDLIKKYAKETGKLEIFTLNDEQRKAWKEATSKIYPDFYDKDVIGKDLIEKTLATE